jgi:predicted porin
MNKNIKLAVAGAVLALSATANAGIIIPAGDWTLDINGNVNAFANYTDADSARGTRAAADGSTTTMLAVAPNAGNNGDKFQGINTGLLPSWLGFTGTTRQNDVDVSFTISLQPNVSDNSYAGDNKTPLNRQAYLTFGDKSWGSFKLGKDIGIFASDAILNDMTLLGVGAGATGSGYGANAAGGASGQSTTLGGIGTGYIYAAWKGQIAYTTPNMNGFQATVGITNPNQGHGTGNQDRFGLEGKASYSFAANDVTGKVWVSGASYDVDVKAVATSYALDTASSVATVSAVSAVTAKNYTASVADIGVNLNAAGFGLTGYYYSGKGVGSTLLGLDAATAAGARRDSDGGYVQLTYATPIKTKIGVAYGISNLDKAGTDTGSTLKSNERITIGAYHPLTKHLNLVAEFNNVESETHGDYRLENKTYSAGAILFF